jgi:alpha-ketoglutarate-dependent taurine dioxygenase
MAMRDFRTFDAARRLPATPHKPVVDPAGWDPDEMRDVDRWSYYLTNDDCGEILDAVANARKRGIALHQIGRDSFPLGRMASLLEDVRRELLDGRGIVRLRDFPLDHLSQEDAFIAYLGIGAYIGSVEPQNKHGHLVGHVKNFRGAHTQDDQRGYQSYIGSSFHVDSTDFVGLLCLHEARSGGDSRIASSVTVYNRLLEERPDLIEPLMMDFYKTRYGEEVEGEAPYYKTPIFSFVDGYFSALGYSTGFDAAQGLPGVPPFTEKQIEAKPVYLRLVEECSIDMPFRKGDIQFLNNYVTVHARHSFSDWPELSRRRHLLRLWLNDPVGRPIPRDRLERRNRGLHLKDVERHVPLELAEAVV